MQYFRRFSLIRSTFRFISSVTVDVNSSTTQHELNEINKLMRTYNTTETPIRTVALFEWMLNIINIKPDFNCYLNIIRACGELDNINVCKKIQQFIENDQTLQINEYHQLQIKLIYMYAKIRNIEQAEKIFQRAKSAKGIPIDISLFGTMFKGYNMNGQPSKTVELYENEILNNKTIELDAIAATCVLTACSDCQRLDIGEYIHDEVLRLDLLNPPNLRLATSIMNMYCNCGSIDRAQEIFNQSLPIVDRIAYSSLMKTYLSINQPVQVLRLFEQSKSSSIRSDPVLYLNVINASNQLGLMHQAEYIHRLIPSHMIENNLLLIRGLIDMHSNCLHLTEAHRLFNLLEQKDNNSLASLLHGYAINGHGQQALNLFEKVKSELIFNEQVYKEILRACAFTGDLVDEARGIYQTIPDTYKTSQVAAAMVSILARASLFDQVESFIHQNKPRLQKAYHLWSAVFMVCYHAKNVEYAKSIYDEIIDDPLLSLLFADMTNSLPSNEIINYFRQEKPGICWTEIKHDDKSNYIIHEFQDNPLSENSELNIVINELKSVDVHWKTFENDLKELFCGHTATRLAIVKNLISTPPNTTIRLAKTKSTCHLCHEGIKQLSLLKKRDIILRDNIRVHHFHNGKCSCRDQF
ncbi:unnamed protein product [Rotaria socialis]|uniref:DYW domain-containing protein n=1 Tax=Rotaria socialis TaxID=392032 RepID=A0A818PQV7_9BILA|nr:unnamed protein product [Rotaria socialis]CAF4132931.1 unnamed protein product [Rotaria socialis]